ncbi:EamA family transporter [Capnocytophaga sp. ARDL2]|uniref:EamA family transporter n=1 Tax=Capnocytophaga sp. ARDL2 TaxID=3238809 RepID=UPI00355932C4
MKPYKYQIIAFLAFFIWGFFSLALKPIAHESSFDILFFRILISAGIITAIAATVKKDTIKKSVQQYKLLPKEDKRKALNINLLGGGILGVNWFLYIFVINQINVQTASYAYLICPIITSFLSFFILKERMDKVQWLAISMCLFAIGLYYIAAPGDLFWAVIVALTYSFYLISQKKNTYFDKFSTLVFQLFVVLTLAIPYYLVKGFSFPTDALFYLCVFIVATLFTIIPLYMNLYALQGANASTIGIMLYINPVIAFSLSIFYFGETINYLQIVAYLIILCSIVIFNHKILFSKKMKTIRA